MSTAPDPLRIALIGFGPKGFGALERLAVELARVGHHRPVVVTLHDPSPHPGAGPIYDPDQPAELLLNFAARHVDVWSPDATIVARVDRPDLVTWLARHHPDHADPDAFVPRRLVGDYLRDATESLLAALPPGLQVRRVPACVTDLERVDGAHGTVRWTLRHDEPDADLEGVDEVLLTTGHGTWRIDPAASTEGTRVVPAVYPTRTWLTPDLVPPGACVGVRGFALTFVDAALALTAGRGGRFVDGPGPVPRYEPSPDAVACLVPFSRTGRPLLAKPGPDLLARTEALAPVFDRLRSALRAEPSTTLAAILHHLADAATAALTEVEPTTSGTAEVEVAAVLADAQDDGPAHEPAEDLLRHSVEVATSYAPPDATWAVGEAWRQAYPALVERVGHGGLEPDDVPGFRRLARGMERLAFGPPVTNVARLLALVDAGVLDLSSVVAPELRRDDDAFVLAPRRGPVVALDVLLDAVVTRPGVPTGTPLLWGLRERGWIRTTPHWEALETTLDAGCVGADGHPTPGLSAIGRASEGWVLGNDTLSRSLHPDTARWARRVVGERAADPRFITPSPTDPALGAPMLARRVGR